MKITNLSNRQFLEDVSWAQEIAAEGPVFVMGGGRPTHVLLSFEAYQKLVGSLGSGEASPDQMLLPGIEELRFDNLET